VRTISILNFKGGVGKTSVAINIGGYLSREGKTVVLIDCDRQRNASSILPQITLPTLREVLMGEAQLLDAIQEARPNLYVVPAHPNLEEATKHITVSGPRKLKLLRNAVQNLTGVDFILFDHAPSYSSITDAVLLASEEILIPVEMETFAMDGLLDMISKLEETMTELEHGVRITGIIPTKINYSKLMTHSYLHSLQDTFGVKVMVPIRTDAQISKSQSKRQTIYEYDPHSKGAADFQQLETQLLSEEARV